MQRRFKPGYSVSGNQTADFDTSTEPILQPQNALLTACFRHSHGLPKWRAERHILLINPDFAI
jgi:hypothetical protein